MRPFQSINKADMQRTLIPCTLGTECQLDHSPLCSICRRAWVKGCVKFSANHLFPDEFLSKRAGGKTSWQGFYDVAPNTGWILLEAVDWESGADLQFLAGKNQMLLVSRGACFVQGITASKVQSISPCCCLRVPTKMCEMEMQHLLLGHCTEGKKKVGGHAWALLMYTFHGIFMKFLQSKTCSLLNLHSLSHKNFHNFPHNLKF